jgi:ADP-ribose pyrophosphatase
MSLPPEHADGSARRVLAEGNWLRLVDDSTWEYAERVRVREIAVIVAVTEAGELLLVEQYRPALRSVVVELPAGLVGDDPAHPDESLEEAAARELEEETGYRAGAIRRLISGPTSSGITNEVITLLWAEQPRKVSRGGGVAGESIAVFAVPLEGVEAHLDARIAAGALVDPKIAAALYYAHVPPTE